MAARKMVAAKEGEFTGKRPVMLNTLKDCLSIGMGPQYGR